MKYLAIFTALLFSSHTLAETSRIENLKQLYEAKNLQQAQEIIDEILNLNEKQNINPNEENFSNQQDNTDKFQTENIAQTNEEEQLFALFFDGLILIEKKEYAKAEESFLKIIELKNDWEQISEVYYWLAQVCFLQKKFSQGIEFLKTIDSE